MLAFLTLSFWALKQTQRQKTDVKKMPNRQQKVTAIGRTVGGEAARHLWMMLLSCSSPSGVSRMPYSSLVTWSRAGRESPSVTWLIIRGKNLFGERPERAPTAFFTA